WAVWSSLIHGAQQIIYFDHSFGGPGFSSDNLGQAYYQTIQPGQTISIYDQVKATDALVEQLAPVLNSPFAMNYVTVDGPHYTYGTPDFTLGGLEVMAKDYNGTFYIFADTRDSERQHNIPATYHLNDPQAVSVTVLNENRTIPVVNGVFTDTFANAWTVHIYQVNDNPSGAPIIASFSPDSGTGGDGITNATTLTLSGSAAANSMVTVFDGQTPIGTAPVNASGAWSDTTPVLAEGPHTFTATDTGLTSVPFVITVDTIAPNTPAISGGTVSGNIVTLNGLAEANSNVA